MHQLCTQHLLRDLEDAAQACPDAVWPGQAAEALRALIHASDVARDQALAAVPADVIAADLKLFRHAVLAGLSQVSRVPGANAKQKPGRTLLECLHDREADVLRFLTDLRIPPTSGPARVAENTSFVYPAEIFPTSVRGTADGISAGAGKFGAFLGALFVPHLLTSVGISGVMGIMAGVSAVGVVLTLVALPEPKGQTLEQAAAEPELALAGVPAAGEMAG